VRSVFRSKAAAGTTGDDAVDRRNPRPFVLQALGWSNRDAVGFVVGVLATIAVLTNVLFLQSGPHPAPMLKSGLIAVTPPAAKQSSVGALSGPRAAVPATAPGKPAPAKPEPQPATRASADIITDIQRELARRGFYDEAVDGRYGSKTEAAIRSFERAAGLKPSTEPNEALLRAITRSNAKPPKLAAGTTQALRPPAPVPPQPATPAAGIPQSLRPPAPVSPQPLRPPAPVPQPSARNDATADANAASKRVLAVQRALADYGYGQIKPTGIVDGQTQAAIVKFERERKLPVTGQVTDRVAHELAAITGRALE
jgi:peptidoglycan hydrolase-like protein with peptidoglycan-binding domain